MGNKIKYESHNPYFNRWFSAITSEISYKVEFGSHNPYFNRWFSAIANTEVLNLHLKVTILILIDGFLQYFIENMNQYGYRSHNPYFNRWFSAI